VTYRYHNYRELANAFWFWVYCVAVGATGAAFVATFR
jgi:hypothetical protein